MCPARLPAVASEGRRAALLEAGSALRIEPGPDAREGIDGLFDGEAPTTCMPIIHLHSSHSVVRTTPYALI